jgi:FtsP/CotA-like multicopper oxidase with cupredoxin domain
MKYLIFFIAGLSLNSCGKHDMGSMMGVPINVIEGSFDQLISKPNEVNGTATLTAQATNFAVNGKSTSVYGYQPDKLLGPTIRVSRNTDVKINFQNKLSEDNNIHWHGLKIPADMDGHPSNVIAAGKGFNYQFTVNQRAGLYWYHPHTHMLTARQVYKGLAGLFIVNDAEESALNLPSGNLEIPLVIQDKRLSSSTLNYNPNNSELMSGFMGESILVNGVAFPYTEVSTRTYRLRVLNGSNARIYNLKLSNNSNFTIIGNDGGLLENAETVNSILLAPGERLDLLVNFAGVAIGTELYLESATFSNGGDAQGKQAFKIMKFKISNSMTDNFKIPSSLTSIPKVTSATKTRNFVLNDMHMSGGHSGSGGHQINSKVYDENRVDETISPNTTEYWVFENKGLEPHPMHLHGVQFQVVERNGGRGLLPSEKGWKDVVLVLPDEKVKIIIPFGSFPGKFVFHCHNLEHEDDGMMLQYLIK